MAWIKVPPENIELFRAALPKDRRIETLLMFGGLAAKVNGNFFGGAFGRSVMLLFSEADRAEALALDGAAPFDPMGNGVKQSDKVQMPESLMDEPEELRAWVQRSFEYAATLPRKAPKAKKKPAAATAVAKKATKQPAAPKKPAAKQPAAAPKKPAAKQPAATAAAKQPKPKARIRARAG
jgi:TfoX/Sxy family transcriptional regulator of competence genes